MWHISDATKAYFESRFDAFGDSYMVDMTEGDAEMLMTSNGDEWMALSDSEVEDEEEMKVVEGVLSLSKVKAGARVKARIEVEGDDGARWRECRVQERDEVGDIVVVTCVEAGSNRKRRHQVVVSSDEILVSEPQRPPEWSSFAGKCVLLLPLAADADSGRLLLGRGGGGGGDGGDGGLSGLRLKLAKAHVINGGGQAVMGVPNLRMEEVSRPVLLCSQGGGKSDSP